MRTYRPTRGLVVGAIGVVGSAIAGLVFGLDGFGTGSVLTCLCLWLFGWLVWVVMLWPRVLLGEREVWLVGSLRTTRLPAERIEHVAVKQYLQIKADGRKHISPVIGHSRAALGRSMREPLRGIEVTEGGRPLVLNEAERLRELIDQMAVTARRRPRPDVPPVTAAWNPLPLAVLAVLLAGLAATVLVRVLG